jgi:bifunctional DNA-binding transcriptional regulator/antitoxin component of YhaV-PrlF toxin-antitoxin module
MTTQTEVRPETVRVIKVGRALYICLPKRIALGAGIAKGDKVVMALDGQCVRMARIRVEQIIAEAMEARENGEEAKI